MASRVGFRSWQAGAILVLLGVLSLRVPATAKGGGAGHGGGHSGGGHSLGGHAGSGHAGGHLAGLIHAFALDLHRGTQGRNSPTASIASPPEVSWPFAGASPAPIHPVPPTSLWLPALSPPKSVRDVAFYVAGFRHHRHPFSRHFPAFPSSDCFFNGVTQVCFFEPFLALLCFSGGVDASFGFGFDGDSLSSDPLDSLEALALGLALPPGPETSSSDAHTAVEAAAEAAATTVGKGVFLLLLKGGTVQAVTDYWLAAGYLEYVQPDGARSHIPLETLDLEETVAVNSRRGLRFVLRSGGER